MYKFHVAPEKELTEYRNVIVDHLTGIIVDETGKLVVEQADEALLWLPEAIFRTTRAGSDQDNEMRVRQLWLQRLARRLHDERDSFEELDPEVNHISMLHPFGWYAYGHLFDSVQRLYHALGTVPAPWKVLHSRADRVVDFSRHMNFLGVAQDQLIHVARPLRVPRLWVSPWQERPANFNPEIYDWIYRRYTGSVQQTRPLRLYLSRNHVKPGERGVSNEAEVVAALKEKGFRVLTGKEPLGSIVGAFHNAEMIVAPHGSLLANCMFCKPSCRVLEFCPDNRRDYSFQSKLKKMSDYRHRLVPADEKYNIEIPLGEVMAFVDEQA